MTTFRWVIDNSEYRQERLDRSSAQQVRRYFDGLNYNRRPMYQDELKDLEKVYKHTLVDLHKQLNSSLPELVDYMEEFVLLHRQTEAVNEKLEVLMAKTNRNNEEDKDEIYG